MSLPIVKQRYGAGEIEGTLRDVDALDGTLDDEEYALRLGIAREMYFRGLVHGHADVEKIEAVREAFGY